MSAIVDVADLERKAKVNIEMMPLDHFMEVNQFDQSASDPVAVTYFKLDEEIRDMAADLFEFKDSYVFKMCWEKHAISLAKEQMEDDEDQIVDIEATTDMIYGDIYLPCQHEYKDIYTRLKKGSIKIEEIKQLFGVYKDKYANLTDELNIMCKLQKTADKQWIDTRVEQIKQYHELHLAVASAVVIMKVKKTLCLQGDFRVLETLMNVVSNFKDDY